MRHCEGEGLNRYEDCETTTGGKRIHPTLSLLTEELYPAALGHDPQVVSIYYRHINIRRLTEWAP